MPRQLPADPEPSFPISCTVSGNSMRNLESTLFRPDLLEFLSRKENGRIDLKYLAVQCYDTQEEKTNRVIFPTCSFIAWFRHLELSHEQT